ncbi:MAG: hypothetical protein ABIQ95_00440 [Bdellovibrionia bacterium]
MISQKFLRLRNLRNYFAEQTESEDLLPQTPRLRDRAWKLLKEKAEKILWLGTHGLRHSTSEIYLKHSASYGDVKKRKKKGSRIGEPENLSN